MIFYYYFKLEVFNGKFGNWSLDFKLYVELVYEDL